MFEEEESKISKKARIFQREKRQELQLIIERCNEVNFKYVCLPSIRNDKDLCFGSKTKRKIHLFNDDKSVNSFMRKNFKEVFPEPSKPLEPKKSDENLELSTVEIRPSHQFASKVPRFLTDVIDSTGVYRRKKKTRASVAVTKKIYSAFGSSNERDLLVTRNPNIEIVPGPGVYNLNKPEKNFKLHSFGGDIKFIPAFEIVCMPMNLDVKCESCEEVPKNVYWKNQNTLVVLCRACYNQRIIDIKKKTRGIVEKLRTLQATENDFEKKRYCDFCHEHNKTTAAVRLLDPKEFKKRIHQENFLNTLFKY